MTLMFLPRMKYRLLGFFYYLTGVTFFSCKGVTKNIKINVVKLKNGHVINMFL